ncbi:unnamed protein product [Rangifer tarandus platyrhynchus]|uniref:Uncharacterized protein n=1 Tax=Rangifer tarandus platyrhynchus TaxID=3082113 RepID=A0AC60A5Z1_RANTA
MADVAEASATLDLRTGTGEGRVEHAVSVRIKCWVLSSEFLFVVSAGWSSHPKPGGPGVRVRRPGISPPLPCGRLSKQPRRKGSASGVRKAVGPAPEGGIKGENWVFFRRVPPGFSSQCGAQQCADRSRSRSAGVGVRTAKPVSSQAGGAPLKNTPKYLGDLGDGLGSGAQNEEDLIV